MAVMRLEDRCPKCGNELYGHHDRSKTAETGQCDECDREDMGFNRAVREIEAMATSNPPYGSMTVYAEAIRHRYPEAFAEGDTK